MNSNYYQKYGLLQRRSIINTIRSHRHKLTKLPTPPIVINDIPPARGFRQHAADVKQPQKPKAPDALS